jgi:HEAT repeat protein
MDADTISVLIKSKKVEDRLRAVRRATRLPSSERQAPLLQLLRDRAGYVAALAAEALGEAADWTGAGEMRERFLWLSEDGLKRDAGCHVRSHLAYAFGRLEYSPAHDALRIGLRTVQIEPVGGVPFDTAASLRANCALALSHLRDPDAVREIAPLLFDNGENRIDRIVNPVGIAKRILPEVRKKMAQALGSTGDPAAAIPLAIKLRFPGDEAAEVLQECMQALVLLESDDAVEVLSPYLAHHDSHLAAYAALMIAQTGDPEAAALLKAAIAALFGDPLRAVILALSALRSDDARSILLGIAEDPRNAARLALVEALSGSGDEADRACLKCLAESDSSPQVRSAAAEALAAG